MGAFEVNVKGTFLCAKAVAPIMKAQGKGVIINIGSSAGRGGPTRPEMAAYASAKAAVMNLTINMAHQWGPEIRVNCIAPGVIDTPRPGEGRPNLAESAARIALGRTGTADEIAEVALFLASDRASFVNGAVVDVHGGK
jgi:3-oxoacyl-[acyl-carrier protein] reductase